MRTTLEGRTAKCGCGTERPSDETLPFFDYTGPGSYWADEVCGCGYGRVAHTQEQQFSRTGHLIVHNVVVEGKCAGFVPRGAAEHDRFYCGCRGWD